MDFLEAIDVISGLIKASVFGFIIAALCAALMSTADTLVNASSAIIVNDVYRPLAKKIKNENRDNYSYI